MGHWEPRMRETVDCRVCGAAIGPHWQLFQHVNYQAPTPELSPEALQAKAKQMAWEFEKKRNRWDCWRQCHGLSRSGG
jgi:hypothetical protein